MKNLIIKPQITEKTLEMSKNGMFTFVVSNESRKEEIKSYIKNVFNVDVISINTLRNAPELKRNFKKGVIFKKGGIKKAIVKLKKGQTIDLFEVEQK